VKQIRIEILARADRPQGPGFAAIIQAFGKAQSDGYLANRRV
jgi:hypothetical protein